MLQSTIDCLIAASYLGAAVSVTWAISQVTDRVAPKPPSRPAPINRKRV